MVSQTAKQAPGPDPTGSVVHPLIQAFTPAFAEHLLGAPAGHPAELGRPSCGQLGREPHAGGYGEWGVGQRLKHEKERAVQGGGRIFWVGERQVQRP